MDSDLESASLLLGREGLGWEQSNQVRWRIAEITPTDIGNSKRFKYADDSSKMLRIFSSRLSPRLT